MENNSLTQIVYKGRVIDRWISREGRVFNSKGKEMLLSDNGAGYLSVHLFCYKKENGQSVSKRDYIHRLMAMTYLDNPENLPQVNHKDCDKSNNRLENLEWASGSTNIEHSYTNGRMKKRYDVGTITPLTPDEVRDVYTAIATGVEKISSAARRVNRPRTTISSIVNKRSRCDITDLIDKELNQKGINMKTLVKFSRDWADEFTAEQFRIFGDECAARSFIKDILESEDEIYFGTNEFYDPSELDYTDFEIIQIGEIEASIITELLGEKFGTGIL